MKRLPGWSETGLETCDGDTEAGSESSTKQCGDSETYTTDVTNKRGGKVADFSQSTKSGIGYSTRETPKGVPGLRLTHSRGDPGYREINGESIPRNGQIILTNTQGNPWSE